MGFLSASKATKLCTSLNFKIQEKTKFDLGNINAISESSYNGSYIKSDSNQQKVHLKIDRIIQHMKEKKENIQKQKEVKSQQKKRKAKEFWFKVEKGTLFKAER